MNTNLPRILAVDDNPKNLTVLKALLTANHYQIDCVQNGRDAIKLANEKDYDLILMDVFMPEMDGFETSIQLKKIQNNSTVPIIFLTARNDIGGLKQGFASGGVDYITKPFDGEELIARVNTHIELKFFHDQQKGINRWLEEKVIERTLELNRANETLEKANKELLTLDAAKTEFLRMINHEVRTPLNALIGFINILKEEKFSAEIKEMIDLLDIASNRLEKFLMVVLLITELNIKHKSVIKEKIRMKALVDASLHNNKNQLKLKNAHLNIICESTDIMIGGNQKLLQSCFDSLLENALEYSEPNSTITLKSSSSPDEIFFEVIDEGRGFSEEALKNLFKFFAIGEQHIDQNIGLALALTKLIMDVHEGKIEVSNNAERGATVKLTFSKKFLTNLNP
ncbi:MAG: hybrid sensor histidine kinase/response regulator [Bacteroidales bacterium]|nr:hybrid sensor histidine kinase/response regulator [Bacteroidales bacterium]MDD4602825.1 hybrid sensor histidine kinase/response regulator [Bacteroidales bacterium]